MGLGSSTMAITLTNMIYYSYLQLFALILLFSLKKVDGFPRHGGCLRIAVLAQLFCKNLLTCW